MPKDGSVTEARQSHPDGRVNILRHREHGLLFVTRCMLRAEHRPAWGFALSVTALPRCASGGSYASPMV